MLIWRQWSYLWTERNDYGDFHLRVEVRLGDRIYSQLLFRDAFNELGRIHVGYAIVLNSTNENPCKTGSLLDLKPVVVVPSSPVPPDQWFTVEVIAKGNRIRVLVNGQTTADYSDPERRLSRGHISLLGVGRNGQRGANPNLAFRKIEIKELPAK
jgi:hypothetical protein